MCLGVEVRRSARNPTQHRLNPAVNPAVTFSSPPAHSTLDSPARLLYHLAPTSRSPDEPSNAPSPLPPLNAPPPPRPLPPRRGRVPPRRRVLPRGHATLVERRRSLRSRRRPLRSDRAVLIARTRDFLRGRTP